MKKTDNEDKDICDFRFLLRLSPGAAQNAFHGWHDNEHGEKTLKATVTTAPEKGKANKAFIKLLSKELGIAKSRITIMSGETSRYKTLEISNITPSERQALLAL